MWNPKWELDIQFCYSEGRPRLAAAIYIFGSWTYIDVIWKHGIQELSVDIEENGATKYSNISSKMREDYRIDFRNREVNSVWAFDKAKR